MDRYNRFEARIVQREIALRNALFKSKNELLPSRVREMAGQSRTCAKKCPQPNNIKKPSIRRQFQTNLIVACRWHHMVIYKMLKTSFWSYSTTLKMVILRTEYICAISGHLLFNNFKISESNFNINKYYDRFYLLLYEKLHDV